MKKIFIITALALSCLTAYALPVGNPSDASLLCDGLIWEGHCGDPCDPCLTWCDALSLRLGFYGDYVFDRHMKTSKGVNVGDTELYTNAGMITANLWDRIDAFGTVGCTNMYIDSNDSAFNLSNNKRFVIDLGSNISWSAGLRATLWECGCTTFGVEGQYFQTIQDIKYITEGAAYNTTPDISPRYYEWQVGFGISHRVNTFVPYIAIKWSQAKLLLDNSTVTLGSDTATLYDLRTRGGLGFAVGVSLIDCEKASLTAEGRFGREKALHINGQVRF